MNLLETLVTSKTRIKLLLKFFLNSNSTSYLRSLATEFGESSNAVRVELIRLEKAGLLMSYVNGNRKYFRANLFHPFYRDIHNILLKYIGIDQIIDKVISKFDNLQKVFLTGNYAEGRDQGTIDLIFVGENVNISYLTELIEKVESRIQKKIYFSVMNSDEFIEYFEGMKSNYIKIWAAC